MSELTPEEMREIRRLHLQAGRKVDALFAGEYRSAMRGQGMEFEEVRPYSPGDDIRHIDWNVTARTGDPFIKVFREERQLNVTLVVDVSGSTTVGSGGADGITDRRRQIARIAGGLAYASFRNRDRVGLVTFTDQVERYLSPRQNRAHVWSIIRAVFEGDAEHKGTDLSEALSFIAKTHKRRSTLVVISDFLDEGPWDKPLATLARKHRVHGICVTDPLDSGLKGLGLVNTFDPETGRTGLLDAAALFPTLTVAGRLERLKKTGAFAMSMSTTDDPFTVLRRQFHNAGRRR